MKLNVPFFKFKAHDYKSLELLYRLYHKQVYSFALYITNDTYLAEDVTQEVFILVYNKIDQLKDSAKLEAWLNRVTINAAYTLLRWCEKNVVVYNDAALADTDKNTENDLVSKELQIDIESVMATLPQEYQQLLYLKYIKGLTSKQISEFMEIPDGTVKSRLKKARDIVAASKIAPVDGGDICAR